MRPPVRAKYSIRRIRRHAVAKDTGFYRSIVKQFLRSVSSATKSEKKKRWMELLGLVLSDESKRRNRNALWVFGERELKKPVYTDR